MKSFQARAALACAGMQAFLYVAAREPADSLPTYELDEFIVT